MVECSPLFIHLAAAFLLPDEAIINSADVEEQYQNRRLYFYLFVQNVRYNVEPAYIGHRLYINSYLSLVSVR